MNNELSFDNLEVTLYKLIFIQICIFSFYKYNVSYKIINKYANNQK